MKYLLMFTTLATLLSCNSYRIVERHIDKKMSGANLSIKTEIISGDTIEYWDNNADKPVAMLIHGFGASTKYQWYEQVKALSKDYRIIAPNLFHFGNSRPGVEKFEIQDQMELVNSLVNHLGIKQMNLFGVSYGGLVSMEYAQNYESKINKLVVFDAPVKYMYEKDIDTICSQFEVESVQDLFVPTNAMELKKLFHLALGKKSPVPNFMLKAFYDNVYSQNHENKRELMTTLLAGLEEYAGHNYDFNTPTMLIWGDTDMVVPVERAPLIKRHIGSNAELHIIKNGAHMPNLTKTKQFNKLVLEFLSRP